MESNQPDEIKESYTVVVIANLYDRANSEQVWTIQSTCFNRQSREDFEAEQTKAIVHQMNKDKLFSH